MPPFEYPETGPHAIHPRKVRKLHADEHFLSDYRYEFPREDPAFPEVYVYTDELSYDPGDTVRFHGSTTADRWTLQVYRDGHRPEMLVEVHDLPGSFSKTSETAYMDGCDWPVLHSWTIPADMRSGPCRVVASCLRKDGQRFVQHHFFTVRPTKATKRGKLLIMLATGTWTAYNDWGGANHYFGTWGPEKNGFSPVLSLKRPWTRGMFWLPKGAARVAQTEIPYMGDAPRYPSKEFGYSYGFGQYYAAAGWAQFDRHFWVWCEEQGFEPDVITQTDLHYRPDLLDMYPCLATSGHDEYWSWEMRKAVEAYCERGNGFARFGGNFLWQIRLEEDGARQVCWKSMAYDGDPVRNGPDKDRLTTAWEAKGVEWPGASTVGVNGAEGVYASWGGFAPRGNRGFTVYRPEHWIFDGTDLRYADVFGAEAGIFGYEVDGLNYTFRDGLPYAVEEPGTPDNIEILAMSPAMLAEYERPGEGVRYYLSDSDYEGLVSKMPQPPEVARARYRHGSGMVVAMEKGRGQVITAGSCEWVMGLRKRDPFTEAITRNVLMRMTVG